MSELTFQEWLCVWLDTKVRPGFAAHAHLIVSYGVESVRDLDSVRAADIRTIEKRFEDSGVPPLHVRDLKEDASGSKLVVGREQ